MKMEFAAVKSVLALIVSVVVCFAGCRRDRYFPAANGSTEIPAGTETVSFANGRLTLHGLLLRPRGTGPFPAVLFNHGSAPGTANNLAFTNIAPLFVARGWVFFMPYRRGQGLSESAGPYIGDEIEKARRAGGLEAAAAVQLRLLQTDHLDDQLSGLAWLQGQGFIRRDQIAAFGNSFGGIEAVLGAERGGYCAAVDASGAAESWASSPALRDYLAASVRRIVVPVLFFQAENDFDLSPTRVLFAAMREEGTPAEMKVYPAFGLTSRDGHSFAYRGSSVWGNDVLQFLVRVCQPHMPQ